MDPPLRSSDYNYFVRYDDHNFLGYNFLYRSILRIPTEAFPAIDTFIRTLSSQGACSGNGHPDIMRLPPQWLEALKETQFLIDSTFDELSLIKFRYYRSLYDNNALSLVVLPTLWCNFACPYCFEFKKPIFMKPDVEQALINWITRLFRNKRFMHIAWFGGEPLLAKRVISRLTHRLQEFCKDIGASYEASMTTNGYFLDERFLASLSSLSIKHITVTLDGDKADHDALRKRRSGKGSFDCLFANIVNFCEVNPECELTLRVNCCDDNYERIEHLLTRFPSSVRNRAPIFFRWIWSNEASRYHDFAPRSRGVDPFGGLSKLYTAAQAIGWQTKNPHHRANVGYCEVDYLDHYWIGPDGNLFLCSHSFDKSEAIGNLLKGDEVFHRKAANEYMRWYSVDPFNDVECLKCKLLPTCWGGCRKTRAEGKRECIEEKESLDLYVRNAVAEQLNRAPSGCDKILGSELS